MKMPLDLLPRLLELAVAIQQIPAPTFAEAQRAAFLAARFQEAGLLDVAQDELGNAYGRWPGAGSSPPLVISAHLDTVFSASTELRVRHEADKIHGPGIGDNSLGLASLLGLLWAMRQKYGKAFTPPGDIWLVANVGEEGLGGLRGMRGVVDRFGTQVAAYLILEGMSLGHIYHRGLGVQRYRITIRTPGGHSWVDYGSPSAVHELAALVTRLTSLPIPVQPRSSLNVGLISGGTSINTIAAEAHLELDLRSENPAILKDLIRQVEVQVSSASRPDVQAGLELIGQRPVGEIPVEHPLVQLAKRSLEAQGLQANLSIGSTDANLPLSRGLPAVCVGLTTGHGAHTINEYIDLKPIAQGLAQVVMLVEGIFGLTGG